MDNAIYNIWLIIMKDCTLSSFFLMLWTLMSKTLLLSIYFSLLYWGIALFKKCLNKKISARANCGCWYFLLFSVVLANLSISNKIIILSYRLMYSTAFKPYVFLIGCLLSMIWLSVVIFKLTTLTIMNIKMKRSMKLMEQYKDSEGLAFKAALALRLRRKPRILVWDRINSPVSYGIINRVILLPSNFNCKYTSNERYLVLLHEMTHIKHCDTIKIHLVNITECFLWSTPAIGLFRKNFKHDAEILCDLRVMNLEHCEKDIYGNLILKECAKQTVQFGPAFSDSYQTIEKRLDALYRFKTGSRIKRLTMIPAAILFICVLSFALRTDWFIINSRYNIEFEVVMFSEDYTLINLPPEIYDGVYEVRDGELFIDIEALYTITRPYAAEGYHEVHVRSKNYHTQTDHSSLSSYYVHSFDIRDVKQASGTVFSDRLQYRSFAEFLFLMVTCNL